MNRFGDLPVADLFQVAPGNGRDRRLYCRVLIRAGRKDSVGFPAPDEDRRLIGRVAGADRLDPFAFCMAPSQRVRFDARHFSSVRSLG